MSTFRIRVRRSDSDVDPDDTTTLRELAELTVTQNDFNEPPTPSPPPTSFPFPTMSAQAEPVGVEPARPKSAMSSRSTSNATSRANSRTSSRVEGNERAEKMVVFKDEVPPLRHTSRSNSRSTTHTNAEDEEIGYAESGKMIVFKDEAPPKDVKEGQQKRKLRSQSRIQTKGRPLKPMASSRVHARAKSETEVGMMRIPSGHPSTSKPTGIGESLTSSVPAPGPTKLEIIEQLHNISLARSDLLRQLAALEAQEQKLISTLLPTESSAQVTDSQPQEPVPIQLKNAHIPTQDLVLRPPTSSASTSRLPAPRHQRKYARASLTRTVSAPPIPNPSASRRRKPSTRKRIPLADKTEESLEGFDSTAAMARQWEASSVKGRTDREEEVEEGAEGGRGRSVKADVKFGDEEHPTSTTAEHHSRDTSRGGRASTPRGRSTASSKGLKRTPAVRTDYAIPLTVLRKKWRF